MLLNHDIPIETLAFDLNDAITQAIERIYQEKINEAARGSHQNTTPLADPNVWKREVDTVMQAIFNGTGTDASVLTNYEEYSAALVRNLQRNLMTFYAFKGHHEAKDLIAALVDNTTGQPRTWPEFKREALAIATQYNINWLKTEYETAFGSAQMAEKWQGFVDDADILGMLKYDAVMDARTRPAHRLLHGTIKPVHDKFWDEHYPPNGWNCRCDVIQLPTDTPEVDPKGYPDDKQHPPAFRNNVGKTGEVFTAQHPFFSTLRPSEREAVMRNAGRLIFDNYDESEWIKEVSVSALKRFPHLANYEDVLGFDAESGGFAVLHIGHEPDAIKDELDAIRIMKRKGKQIELIDESNKDKGPDCYTDSLFWEIKRYLGNKNPEEAIVKKFKQAVKQKAIGIVLYIDNPINHATLIKYVYDAARQAPKIKYVKIIIDGAMYEPHLSRILAKDW